MQHKTQTKNYIDIVYLKRKLIKLQQQKLN